MIHLTDRSGGVSAAPYDALNLGDHVGDDPTVVAENRRRLARQIGMQPAQLVFMRQVHGADVEVVDDPGELPVADALVTTRPRLPLVVLVADCVPVVLTSTDPPVVAVAHAGRRGLVAGVVSSTIEAMRRLGASPQRMAAFLGPSVCGRCYEVPFELQASVEQIVPAAHATTRSGTPALDVSAGVRAQLEEAGLAQIELDSRCTSESPELYSHRRDGQTGRFATVAWLRE